MPNNDHNILEVFASEDIVMADVPPGTPASANMNEEKLPQEEIEKRQKIMTEYTRLMARYVDPHNNRSRFVKTEDLDRILADGKDLVAMCSLPRGKYGGIAALAHSQIDDKDPLRFFVLPSGMVVINPVVINHTKVTVMKEEGCLTFPDNDIKTDVPRYNKVTVIYQTLEKPVNSENPVISKPKVEGMSGGMAHVFQHEISHLNGCQIYDADFAPESCEGLGDGLIPEENVKKLYE
jgi:peptide deformylase